MVEAPSLELQELVLRLLLAGLFGAVIGFEREYRDRTAGLRTHMLVCIGSAAFTLISIYAFTDPDVFPLGDNTGQARLISDPSRVAAQIVSGIGFLGAGAIFRAGGSVRGLTTAASLWAMAAIGMAVGAGAYAVAAVSTVVIVIVLALLRQTSRRIKRLQHHERAALDLHLRDGSVLGTVLDRLGEHHAAVMRVVAQPEGPQQTERRVRLNIDVPPETSSSQIVGALLAIEGVSGVEYDEHAH